MKWFMLQTYTSKTLSWRKLLCFVQQLKILQDLEQMYTNVFNEIMICFSLISRNKQTFLFEEEESDRKFLAQPKRVHYGLEYYERRKVSEISSRNSVLDSFIQKN
jgi:hypothetical protein